MVEKCKEALDKGGAYAALFTDLSKAFDCIDHDLLTAKLNAFGMDTNSVKLLHSYLTDRKQRVKINSVYSEFSEILNGVPQGSILGPLLFNIFMIDLFMSMDDTNIANYADDTTPYVCGNDITVVMKELETASVNILKWFNQNGMKLNEEKCHVICNGGNDITAKIGNTYLQNGDHQNILGINLDKKLSSDTHVKAICNVTSKKLHALARVAPYMGTHKKRFLMKSFIFSQFNYCPLVWMNHSRKLNNRINNLQERSLRIAYNDYRSSFDELLQKDNSVTVHVRNLRTLVTEVYKTKYNLNPQIMNEVFKLQNPAFNLRYCGEFIQKIPKTVMYGTETVSYLGPKIWKSVPADIRNAENLVTFKQKIKSWVPENCPCRLCKTYIQGVGFIN